MVSHFKKGCVSCRPTSYEFDICEEEDSFAVEIQWDGPCRDLDTSVKYNNATSGFSCDTRVEGQHNPAFISNDIMTGGGTEYHFVRMEKPGEDDDDKIAYIYCHWHTSQGGVGCPVQVRVTREKQDDPTQVLDFVQDSITIVSQGCSASVGLLVAQISFKSDDTWELIRMHNENN